MFDEYVRTHLPAIPPAGIRQIPGSTRGDLHQVLTASTEAEKEEIYRLRYQVYIEEMRGQLRHSEADSVRQQFRDQWDETAYHFYIRESGTMLACARLNLRRHGPVECETQFELEKFSPFFPDNVCMTSRLVLHRNIRGSHLLKLLACAMYGFGREQGMRLNFIDCHPQWLPLYSRLGYRVYRPGFNHQKYTYVIPMVLVGDDLDYLRQVKSPFVPIARRYRASVSGRQLLLSRFPHAAHVLRGTLTEDGSPRDLLSDRLSDDPGPIERFDLLRGMTLEEGKVLFSLGHVVSCRSGDAVLSPGDPGREIFLILSGSFQVQKRIGTQESKMLKILAAGETFGEIRFLREELRQASVKARENATLLVLNAKALDRLVTSAPKIAAKLFRNLARIVAMRQCDSVRFVRFSKPRVTRPGETYK
jgi:CRP-like cAMP-binding protein